MEKFQITSINFQTIFKLKNFKHLNILILNLFVICLELLFASSAYLVLVTSALAVVDPLSVPNNKFGIHIIQPSTEEASPAATLVNSSGGDWGYVTVLVESKNRDIDAWQKFFNELRRRHLIPIVRLATKPLNAHWEKPYEKEYEAWADFLNSLIWPTKNRYVVIYNEPNHGKEWGLETSPVSYAHVLSSTIDALKTKSDDFFVLNAGFDQSAPHRPPEFYDEEKFLKEMEKAVPGIFNKLDGWVSHSYPNPGFTGSPADFGRGSIRGWIWEFQILQKLGLMKELPVFITETGWKHMEGIKPDKSLPTSDVVSKNFQDAFTNAWNSSRIAAITPFLLNYQEVPFDHFSFKKLTGEKQKNRILGIQYPEYYPQYKSVLDMPKNSGRPVQDNKAELVKGEVYSFLVAGQNYTIGLTFKNTGQSIWNEYEQVMLVSKISSLQGDARFAKRALEARTFNIDDVSIPENLRIEPGNDYTFTLNLKAPQSGKHQIILTLFSGNKKFESNSLEFSTEVKSPVILIIKSALGWKKDFSGEYILGVEGASGRSSRRIMLDSQGSATEEAKYLLPGYTFDFTLEKPFFKPKTITKRVESGNNMIDFGELAPNILFALFNNPSEFWKLLPFSN